MLSKELSLKISITSLLAMMAVVLLHSYNINYYPVSNSFSYQSSFFIQKFFSDGICRLAVPYFFFISGYLFFINIKGKAFEFFSKIKKRFQSLFIPYIFWSLLGILIYFLLQVFPISAPFFNGKLINEFSLIDFAKYVFISPLPYQLWFIRFLFLLVLLSPLLYIILNKIGTFFLILLGFIWLQGKILPYMVDEAFLFFSLGSYFAIKQIDIGKNIFNKKTLILLALIWLILLFLRSAILLYTSNQLLEFTLLRISIIPGILFVWYFIYSNDDSALIPSINYSFFIFAFHEPLLTILKKILIYINNSVEFSLIIYFLAPVLTLIISIILAKILKNKMAGFYNFICGNR